MNHDAQKEIHYRLLKLLAEEPQMRQKDMAKRMGISVGVKIEQSDLEDLVSTELKEAAATTA